MFPNYTWEIQLSLVWDSKWLDGPAEELVVL